MAKDDELETEMHVNEKNKRIKMCGRKRRRRREKNS